MEEEIIEFIKDWSSCWKKGNTFERSSKPQFAVVVVEAGYAKAINKPTRHKMILKPEKEK